MHADLKERALGSVPWLSLHPWKVQLAPCGAARGEAAGRPGSTLHVDTLFVRVGVTEKVGME
eukprot:5337483-Amphidinium_carterae.1